MPSILNFFKKSLAVRLMVVFAAASAAILILILSILIYGFAFQWKANVRPHLEQYLDYINADIGNPPNIERAKLLAERLPINIYIKGGGLQYSSTGSALDVAEIKFESRQNKWRHQGNNYLNKLEQKGQIVMFGESENRMIMRSQIDQYQIYFELSHHGKTEQASSIGFWSLLFLFLILGISFWQLRRMLTPVQDIKIGVKKMGGGQLDYQVPVRQDNDLGELSSSINKMAADITQMLDAKRQLLLAVSHELRSPLTRAKIATQMLPDSTNKARLEEDLMEMETLITDILETERINTPHAILNRVPVELEQLIASVIDELPANKVSLEILQSTELPLFELDEKRIRLLMRNTIANAICHGGASLPASCVQLSFSERQIQIKVIDYGAGIAAQDLAHVTEPFYRADPSRTRDTGGFGIGLYLCKLIVEAHAGQLSISSEVGRGTCVKIVLPV